MSFGFVSDEDTSYIPKLKRIQSIFFLIHYHPTHPFHFPQRCNFFIIFTSSKKESLKFYQQKNGGCHIFCFPPTFCFCLHPGRLTLNLKITYLKRKIIFQTSIIMFHVNLQGCIFFVLSPPTSLRIPRFFTTKKTQPAIEPSPTEVRDFGDTTELVDFEGSLGHWNPLEVGTVLHPRRLTAGTFHNGGLVQMIFLFK